MAAVGLGNLLREQGDADGARAAYQLAINSGQADSAPAAATNLAVLLLDQSDIAGARAALRQAISFGHPEIASEAQRLLHSLN